MKLLKVLLALACVIGAGVCILRFRNKETLIKGYSLHKIHRSSEYNGENSARIPRFATLPSG